MLVILQNDPEVPAGNLCYTLNGLGISFRTFHPYAGETLPDTGDLSAVIVLGGAMGVHETDEHPFLLGVKELILSCVRTKTPFLGICLGGQLLADVLGGRVITGSPYGEKGTMPVFLTPDGINDPLFAGIPHEFVSFQWHNDSFEVPPGGTLLASSKRCEGQAFRYGSCAWGTQFHPEVEHSIVNCWARWTEETRPQADRFVEDFAGSEKDYLDVSRKLLGNFLRIAGYGI